jgi:hypothetical protein
VGTFVNTAIEGRAFFFSKTETGLGINFLNPLTTPKVRNLWREIIWSSGWLMAK